MPMLMLRIEAETKPVDSASATDFMYSNTISQDVKICLMSILLVFYDYFVYFLNIGVICCIKTAIKSCLWPVNKQRLIVSSVKIWLSKY